MTDDLAARTWDLVHDGLDTDVSPVLMLAGAESSPSILVFPDGKGEVVALAGSDLAENRRLALGDNLAFWLALASRGRVYFDEYHHQIPADQSREVATSSFDR